MKKTLLIIGLLVLGGCVGSPVHSTLTYGSVKKTVNRNNTALMKLKAGMSQNEVQVIIGKPERNEGYPWGSVWLYRTAMTLGINGSIYGSVDADYTPVMFNNEGVLQGWGRNYFEQYVNKYELTIKNTP
jgi:outer membrane protein assembly factor BamE (lipoprotein component of BamABCDE complex)